MPARAPAPLQVSYSAVHLRIPDARCRPWNAAITQDACDLVEHVAHERDHASHLPLNSLMARNRAFHRIALRGMSRINLSRRLMCWMDGIRMPRTALRIPRYVCCARLNKATPLFSCLFSLCYVLVVNGLFNRGPALLLP
jgi:hypothetical protein